MDDPKHSKVHMDSDNSCNAKTCTSPIHIHAQIFTAYIALLANTQKNQWRWKLSPERTDAHQCVQFHSYMKPTTQPPTHNKSESTLGTRAKACPQTTLESVNKLTPSNKRAAWDAG